MAQSNRILFLVLCKFALKEDKLELEYHNKSVNSQDLIDNSILKLLHISL